MLKFTSVLVMALILGVGFAGCDKAEEAMQNTDLGATAEASKLLGSATKSLAGITDVESAKAALPALKDLDLDLGKLMAKVKDMSPEQKSKLTGAVSKAMPQLESAMAKVTSMAGVGDIVGPTLESLMGKFKGMM
jgi:hypothetical protein